MMLILKWYISFNIDIINDIIDDIILIMISLMISQVLVRIIMLQCAVYIELFNMGRNIFLRFQFYGSIVYFLCI